MANQGVAERAVRDYLTFLDDPSQLVDQKAIARLEQQVSEARDPIQRLKLFAKVEELRNPIEAHYREAFVAHVKDWASVNGIAAPAFLRMGVPEEVLDQAGLPNPVPRAYGAADNERGSSRRSVTTEEVAQLILKRRAPFSLQMLRSATSASQMTIRKALNELLASGEVRPLGPDPSWTSAGRAPNLYEPTRKIVD